MAVETESYVGLLHIGTGNIVGFTTRSNEGGDGVSEQCILAFTAFTATMMFMAGAFS